MLTVTARFWAKVNKDGPLWNGTPCWLWQARKRRGYGGFKVKEGGRWRTVYAHRYAYELLQGPIPEELEIDHLCRTHACVRPTHLEAVTHAQNMERGVFPQGPRGGSLANVLKTHCHLGHPFDEINTYHLGKRRFCRTCNVQAATRYRLNNEKEVKP